jgi:hypothetical protein
MAYFLASEPSSLIVEVVVVLPPRVSRAPPLIVCDCSTVSVKTFLISVISCISTQFKIV